jgi:hypothetical protein
MATIPCVVKFAFCEFTENSVDNKWSAKCSLCRSVLVEKIGVTSAFIKLVWFCFYLFLKLLVFT